ncbi:hypothetical protein HMPREF9241_01702 [Schaalia turicensis ACS-279-V-Col4]|uniref:DUF3168 domain-containing protein n=1 Tax=Schaalia turicensis ACS-279-V-Col4 TaxID=883077 RepID=K0YN76_9ACTO|nr:hypothetical protein [Schaalia turicensis]EJZ84926.1 hypothetical protein HMPREF9241_01702 [Schaalia turicensis ACS-279-V-Col4]
MTPEEILIKALADGLRLRVSGDVPATRPDAFVTVERTGGAQTRFLDHGTYAVQVWAKSRANAGKLAQTVASYITNQLPTENAHIGRSTVESLYHFPDPDSPLERYQLTVSAVITLS